MSRSVLGLGRSGGQVIGVHVRHGDACEASTGYRTPCQPVEAYMKEVKIIASTYGVREVRHVAIQQLRVIQYLSVPCLPSLLSILCPIFRPRLHPFFSLPSLFFSISLFSKEPFNSPTCQVFIASDDPTALAKATQDEDLLVSFVPLDRSMLQVTSRFSHVRVTGPSLKMHCYCPAQKGPGTERAWYRKGLVQKGPGAERAWSRKGLEQKGPGAEGTLGVPCA